MIEETHPGRALFAARCALIGAETSIWFAERWIARTKEAQARGWAESTTWIRRARQHQAEAQAKLAAARRHLRLAKGGRS